MTFNIFALIGLPVEIVVLLGPVIAGLYLAAKLNRR
jgi:hypothetical protein